MKLLKTLYKIFNPSESYRMVEFISGHLKKLNISFNISPDHHIYRFIEGSPLISCHTDSVSDSPVKKIVEVEGSIFGLNNHGQINIGADDKNGIWICLGLLSMYPNLSFCFSADEEKYCGRGLVNLLDSNSDVLKNIPYGIVFDRHGSSDIVVMGAKNIYCCKEFEISISGIGKFFNYKSNVGIVSDADYISDYLSCVNLSVGYHCQHTDSEYTIFSQLVNAFNFGSYIISNLVKKFDAPPKLTKWVFYK